MSEEWRQVEGFDGFYEVSSLGNVRSFHGTHTGVRILRPDVLRNGYLLVTLWNGKKRRREMIHVLVLEAFVSKRPPGMYACHDDGTRTNNVVGNLRWDTAAGNNADKRKHGTHQAGTNNPMAKLSNSTVLVIRAMAAAGIRNRKIADRFGIRLHNVQQIVSRRSWRHIP
jgi:hypothetical protein